jgi:hypothetical protein
MSRTLITRSVGALLLLAAILGASAGSGAAAGGGVPQSLVGTWTKTVKASTWAKHGITYEKAGHWVITFSSNGVLTLFQPPGKQADLVTHMSASTAGAALVVGPTADGFCPDKATYAWTVSGEHLLIGGGTKDSCDARTILFGVGAWARK